MEIRENITKESNNNSSDTALKKVTIKGVELYVSREGRAFKDEDGIKEYAKIEKVSKGRKYIGIALKKETKDGEEKYIWTSLARIVAEAFLEAPDMEKLGASRPEQLCTEAIDGDRTNVRADNLVWSVPWMSKVKVCPYCKKGVRGKSIHPECAKKMQRKKKNDEKKKILADELEKVANEDDTQLMKMLEMRKDGLSYGKIGDQLGISRQAVCAKLKRIENKLK